MNRSRHGSIEWFTSFITSQTICTMHTQANISSLYVCNFRKFIGSKQVTVSKLGIQLVSHFLRIKFTLYTARIFPRAHSNISKTCQTFRSKVLVFSCGGPSQNVWRIARGLSCGFYFSIFLFHPYPAYIYTLKSTTKHIILHYDHSLADFIPSIMSPRPVYLK